MKRFLLVCVALLALSFPVATMADTPYTFDLPVPIQVEVPNGYMIFDQKKGLYPTNLPEDILHKIDKLLEDAELSYMLIGMEDGLSISAKEIPSGGTPDFITLNQSELEKVFVEATRSTPDSMKLLSKEIVNYNGISYFRVYYDNGVGYGRYLLMMCTVVNEHWIYICFINDDTEIDDSYSSKIDGFMNEIRFTGVSTPEPTQAITQASASGRTNDKNSLDQNIAIWVAVGVVALIVFVSRLLKKKESSSSASIFSPDSKSSSSDYTLHNQDGMEQNPYYPHYQPEPSTLNNPTHLCPYCGLPTPKDSPCKYCGK